MILLRKNVVRMKCSTLTTTITIAMLVVFPVLLQAKRMMYQTVTPSIKQQLSRYEYTGQEKELKLTTKKEILNYRARVYDAKLRGFLSADQAKEQWGAYTYVANNPVSLTDATGQIIEYYPGTSEEQITKIEKMLDFIISIDLKRYGVLLEEIKNSPKKLIIHPELADVGFENECNFKNIYTENPEFSLKINTNIADGYRISATSMFGVNPPFVALFHELFGHAYIAMMDPEQYRKNKTLEVDPEWTDGEEQRTIKLTNEFVRKVNQKGTKLGLDNIGIALRHKHVYDEEQFVSFSTQTPFSSIPGPVNGKTSMYYKEVSGMAMKRKNIPYSYAIKQDNGNFTAANDNIRLSIQDPPNKKPNNTFRITTTLYNTNKTSYPDREKINLPVKKTTAKREVFCTNSKPEQKRINPAFTIRKTSIFFRKR